MEQKRKRVGHTQKKVLLLLLGGLALGMTRSPRQYFRILRGMKKEWDWISKSELESSIHKLYRTRLISEKHNRDGTTTITLSESGRNLALTYNLDTLILPKTKIWDKKWRLVTFDIPERIKKVRDALRYHLKKIGMCEFQKSLFIYPHDCKNEIDFIIEFYGARKYVRFILADAIDNELEFKKYFNLL